MDTKTSEWKAMRMSGDAMWLKAAAVAVSSLAGLLLAANSAIAQSVVAPRATTTIPGIGSGGGSGGSGGGLGGIGGIGGGIGDSGGGNTSGTTTDGSAEAVPDKSVLARTEQLISDDEGAKLNLMKAFDGWSQLFHGYGKSPILIDPHENFLKRVYPENRKDDSKRPSLEKVYKDSSNVAVDDEVYKTKMSLYQPHLRMIDQHLMDEYADKHYLYGITSKRANTNFTLAGLDKTIAAILTATQQQADLFVSTQVMKEIAWSASKAANPQRAQIYDDTDEKVEYCMGKFGKDGQGGGGGGQGGGGGIPHENRTEWECDKKVCGDEPKVGQRKSPTGGGGGNSQDFEQTPGGLFRYCICCAETAKKLNKVVPEGEAGKWTLVEKIFGIKVEESSGGSGATSRVANPLDDQLAKANDESDDKRLQAGIGGLGGGGGGGGDEKEKVKKVAKAFREMYGDYEIKSEEGKATYKYKFPKYSMPEKIAAFRNGCQSCKDGLCTTDHQMSCPMTGQFLKYGICPAIEEIFKDWEEILKAEQQGEQGLDRWKDIWVEASLGIPLASRDIMGFISLLYPEGKRSVPKDKIKGEMRRVVDMWCDASAVAAFRSFHTRFRSIMLDHLALNANANPDDRARLIGLVDRIGGQLSLGEMDAKGNYMAAQMLQGVGMHYDRKMHSYVATMAQATRSHVDNIAQMAGDVSFGSAGQREDSGSNGGGSVTRKSYKGLAGFERSVQSTPSPVAELLQQLSP